MGRQADRADCHTTAQCQHTPAAGQQLRFRSAPSTKRSRCLGLKSRIPRHLGASALFCHRSTPRERRLRYRLGISGHPTTPKDQQPGTLGRTKTCVGSTARVLIVPISAPFATGLMHISDTSITEQRPQHTVHRSSDPLHTDLEVGRLPDAAAPTSSNQAVAVQPNPIFKKPSGPRK